MFDESCSDPSFDGWVGVTDDLRQRIAVHRCQPPETLKRLGIDIKQCQFRVLHEGSRAECLEVEARLRPHENCGWNAKRGGIDRPPKPESERKQRERKRREHKPQVKSEGPEKDRHKGVGILTRLNADLVARIRRLVDERRRAGQPVESLNRQVARVVEETCVEMLTEAYGPEWRDGGAESPPDSSEDEGLPMWLRLS